MPNKISGIHHVTAIAGSPQENVDFYAGALGMRLVKLTVNFDDPESYHFYYGDESGRPGSLITFFPHPGGYSGRLGTGQAAAVALAVPEGSLDFWINRLSEGGIAFEGPEERFGDQLISLSDPDGLRLEIIHSITANCPGWDVGPVAAEHAIRGVHSVTLLHNDSRAAVETLVGQMGYEEHERSGERVRYAGTAEGVGRYVDLVEDTNAPSGRVAVGSVHHVAFRTPDSGKQKAWREQLVGAGYGVSPVMERDYFRSIYFREPGGVLFEIATDGPGMAIDEPLQSLGTTLRLPTMYETHRAEIERALLPIRPASR